ADRPGDAKTFAGPDIVAPQPRTFDGPVAVEVFRRSVEKKPSVRVQCPAEEEMIVRPFGQARFAAGWNIEQRKRIALVTVMVSRHHQRATAKAPRHRHAVARRRRYASYRAVLHQGCDVDLGAVTEPASCKCDLPTIGRRACRKGRRQ